MMVTLLALVHAPLVMVHFNTELAPIVKPVTPDIGSLGSVIVAVPDTTLHAPMPVVTVLAVKVVVVILHRFWLAPATEVVGGAAIVIITSSVDAPQAGLLMDHLKVTLLPAVKPVTVLVGEVGVVIVAAPDTTVHCPVPVLAVLPAKVVLVTLHRFWSDPALAMVAGAAILITIVSVDVAHGLLLMVHTRVALVPTVMPVTALVGELGVLIVAVPDINVHKPVPTAGVFAAKVLLVTLHRPWSAPALAVVGRADTFMVTSSLVLPQPPLLIVHLKVTLAPAVKPVTVVVADVGVVIVAVPDTTVHSPVPTVAVFPDNVVLVTLHRF